MYIFMFIARSNLVEQTQYEKYTTLAAYKLFVMKKTTLRAGTKKCLWCPSLLRCALLWNTPMAVSAVSLRN